jgi:hypothetical protein
MEHVDEWKTLQTNIQAAFAGVPPPNLENIPVLGCCEEHEIEYQWYRQNSWQDFELAQDSANFVTLHPLAFHYFTPGVLIAVLESLNADEDRSWHDEYWLLNFIVPFRQYDEFKQSYLPYFTDAQRKVVAVTLAWYKKWYHLEKGYDYDERDKNDEPDRTISGAITSIWLQAT